MSESQVPPPTRRPVSNAGEPDSSVYLLKDGVGLAGTLWLLGGITAFGVALVGFVVCLIGRVGQFTLHLSTTMPVLVGIGAVIRGWGAIRSPSEITVDSEEITIVTGGNRRRIPWEEIGLASATEAPMTNKRRLTLYDQRGGALVTIHNNFADFEQLVEQVRRHVAEQAGESAESLRMKKARRSAAMMAAFGVFMGAAAIFSAYDTWNTARSQALLAGSGVAGEGRVLRHFLAPNGVTCRLEYEVTGDNGRTATRNAEVEPLVWQAMEGAQTVAIRYVPAEPEISKLTAGEVQDGGDGPPGGYLLSAGGGVMMLLFFGVAVMQFYGYDYGTNPKTGKLGFFKLGT